MRCPQCLQRVATKYQHRVDGTYVCVEPGIDVVLGNDKPVPPKPKDK